MATERSPSIDVLVRRFRRAAKLTQEELAERAQVSAPTISALERGISQMPHPDTLDRIAEALQLSPEERAPLHDARRSYLARSVDAHRVEVEAAPAPTSLLPALSSFLGQKHELATVQRLL